MDKAIIAKELLAVSRELVADDDPMAKERMASLYVKLETWVTKKLEKIPASAPVAAQLVKGMTGTRKAIQSKMNLSGTEAVQTFINAMKRYFTMDAPPIPYLVKKYGQSTIREMFHGW